MGCGGSRADAIEPRYYESWTRETESTWLTYTDSDSPPQEPGGAEAGGREQGAGRSGKRGRAGGEGGPRAGMGLGGAGHCARDEGGIGNEEL
uniref:BAALC binder of MAP3K1 and KLF4 n=1 Tax=Cairina moschata TaxID=8855 RepID=A0A8C3BI36_CAIMO